MSEAEQQPSAPTPRDIAERAHAIYIARGGKHGFDKEDWFQAEKELQAELSSQTGEASGPQPDEPPPAST